jgi:conjugative transfer signal peptidase TraF
MQMKNYKAIVIIAIFVLLAGVVLAVRKAPYYLNLSDSEPWGIYQLTPFDGRLIAGELVFMEVPDQARPYVYGRGWLPEGALLLKNIGAVPGDKVIVDDHHIAVNGRYIGPISMQDHEGKPLPRLRGFLKIQSGLFLPISNRIPNSFDGRYFGPVPLRLILGKAKPVFIFKR